MMKKNNSTKRGLQDGNQPSAPPEKVGWVRKFCGKGIFREIWKNRYVVLKGDQLYISEKEGLPSPGSNGRGRKGFLITGCSSGPATKSLSSCKPEQSMSHSFRVPGLWGTPQWRGETTERFPRDLGRSTTGICFVALYKGWLGSEDGERTVVS